MGRGPVWGGCGPPTQALFGEYVCENERIGYRRGGRVPESFVCRSTNYLGIKFCTMHQHAQMKQFCLLKRATKIIHTTIKPVL